MTSVLRCGRILEVMHCLDVPYYKQDTKYTCGPAALQMVLGYYGICSSEQALAEELGTDPESGTRRVKMAEIARSRGLHCHVDNDAPFDEIRFFITISVPIVVRFLETGKNEDHYGVVVSASDDALAIHDPWHGPCQRFHKRDFMTRWTCDVIGDCNQWLMAVAKDPIEGVKRYRSG